MPAMDDSTPPAAQRGTQPPPGKAREPGHKARRRHWIRLATAVLGGGVILAVLIIDRHMLGQSLSSLRRLNLGWFAAAVACELVSLAAFAFNDRACRGSEARRKIEAVHAQG